MVRYNVMVGEVAVEGLLIGVGRLLADIIKKVILILVLLKGLKSIVKDLVEGLMEGLIEGLAEFKLCRTLEVRIMDGIMSNLRNKCEGHRLINRPPMSPYLYDYWWRNKPPTII